MASDKSVIRRLQATVREANMDKLGKSLIYTGIGWTMLFAAMSFYWAAGGMIGVESLGGAIYEKALERDPGFVPVVWATGFIKLAGAVLLLLLLLRHERHAVIRRLSARICTLAGILMFLYGLGNFITVALAGLNVLDFDLSDYAVKWRLIFWEPFWMVGGLLYFAAGRGNLRK